MAHAVRPYNDVVVGYCCKGRGFKNPLLLLRLVRRLAKLLNIGQDRG